MCENTRDVWVYIETEEGKAKAVGYELLTPGRLLADKMRVRLVAVVIGDQIRGPLEKAGYLK